jgi:hypothetical protein
LFISKVKFSKNDIAKIQPANPASETISLVDSLVIKFVFSIKNIKKLQIIQNMKANK